MNEAIAELPKELQKLAMRQRGLAEQNEKRLRRFASVNLQIDVAFPYVSFLLDFLANEEVITQKQKFEFAVAWEEHLRKQLTELEKKIEEAAKKAPKERLWTPGREGVPPVGTP